MSGQRLILLKCSEFIAIMYRNMGNSKGLQWGVGNTASLELPAQLAHSSARQLLLPTVVQCFATLVLAGGGAGGAGGGGGGGTCVLVNLKSSWVFLNL